MLDFSSWMAFAGGRVLANGPTGVCAHVGSGVQLALLRTDIRKPGVAIHTYKSMHSVSRQRFVLCFLQRGFRRRPPV